MLCIAASPGTGKTRLLEEIPSLIKGVDLDQRDFNQLSAARKDIVRRIQCEENSFATVFVTYHNGNGPFDFETKTETSAYAFARRVLFCAFAFDKVNFYLNDVISSESILGVTVTTEGVLDIIRDAHAATYGVKHSKENPLILFIAVDEFQKLIKPDGTKVGLKRMMEALGEFACKGPSRDVIVLPIVAGTLFGDLDIYFNGSMFPHFKLQLPLLTIEASVKIAMSALPNVPWETDFFYRRAIEDMGGLPRAIEILLGIAENSAVTGAKQHLTHDVVLDLRNTNVYSASAMTAELVREALIGLCGDEDTLIGDR